VTCTGGRKEIAQLNFLFLLGGERFLRGLRFGSALLELVHAARRVHELLLSRVKRVADVADTHDDRGFGRTRFNYVAAGATNFRVHIFRMNFRLHKKDDKLNTKTRNDKGEFCPRYPPFFFEQKPGLPKDLSLTDCCK
jgi:hypothetical protein